MSPWQSQNASFSKTNPYPTHDRLAAKLNPLAPTMTPTWFLTYHEVPEIVQRWLSGLGVRDPERAVRDLADLTRRAGTGGLELFARIAVQLDVVLPKCADPGMAIANLERSWRPFPGSNRHSRNWRKTPGTTEILLQVFSTSQYLTEVLVRDPGLLDWLQGGPDRRDRSTMIDGLWASVPGLPDEDSQKLALRRFRQRETLRIGYNDIVRGYPLEMITQDLSDLADACVEAAVRLARGRAEARFGVPMTARGVPARFVVFGLGKLGGQELNYSSDIDLVFLYDEDGQTTGPKVVSNAEFFARMGSDLVRLLADHTALGIAYRVDMRLRPDGEQGALARSLDATLGYYVTRGGRGSGRHSSSAVPWRATLRWARRFSRRSSRLSIDVISERRRYPKSRPSSGGSSSAR